MICKINTHARFMHPNVNELWGFDETKRLLGDEMVKPTTSSRDKGSLSSAGWLPAVCPGAGTCPHSSLPVAVWPLVQCGQCAHNNRGMVPVPATRTHHTCRTLLFMLGYLGKGIRFDIQCTWMAWCFHQCSGCRMFKYVFIHLNNIYIKYFYVFQYYIEMNIFFLSC